jgi:hypothetical protein
MSHKSEGTDSIVESLKKELGQPGPASPELCDALGIDPRLIDDMPGRPTDTPRPTRRAASDTQESRPHFRLSKEEKSILVDSLTLYLSNKSREWWNSNRERRMHEMDFVTEVLSKALSQGGLP